MDKMKELFSEIELRRLIAQGEGHFFHSYDRLRTKVIEGHTANKKKFTLSARLISSQAFFLTIFIILSKFTQSIE